MNHIHSLSNVLVFIAVLLFPFAVSAQWQFEGSPSTCRSLDIAVEGDTILALTTAGLFFSTDDAASWQRIPGPQNVFHENRIQVDKGILYTISSRGEIINDTLRYLAEVSRSDDWGLSWHSS